MCAIMHIAFHMNMCLTYKHCWVNPILPVYYGINFLYYICYINPTFTTWDKCLYTVWYVLQYVVPTYISSIYYRANLPIKH